MGFTPTISQGSRLYVRGMAASSIASKSYALSTHDECGTEVAWAQSLRTGKWYPAETAEYTTEVGNREHLAVPWKPHTCPLKVPVPSTPEEVTEYIVNSLIEEAERAEANDDPDNAAKIWQAAWTEAAR